MAISKQATRVITWSKWCNLILKLICYQMYANQSPETLDVYKYSNGKA